MATWSRSEKTTTTTMYSVPAPWPQGATWADVERALEAAKGEARRLNGGNPIGDDAVWVKPVDDKIIVYFEVEVLK